MDEASLELREVMRRLRAECPWWAEQTHRSLARYLLEETHETLEVLDASEGPDGPDDAHLTEELGDLLLQVYFHADIAEERGAFTIDDVSRAIAEKMVRRNPHVFGTHPADPADREPLDAAAVDAMYQQIKSVERPPSDLPPSLPALLMAAKTLERRARAGRPAPASVGADGDLGDRLLALVAEAAATGTDPEQALRDAVRRLT